ncbi:MAG: SCP2 sterol-binding domain-containing protein [Acidimicrobiia bacterium]
MFSDEWLAALEAAARSAGIRAEDRPLVLQQVVTDGRARSLDGPSPFDRGGDGHLPDAGPPATEGSRGNGDGSSTGEVAYVIRIDREGVTVRPGRAADADVTFTQDRATAAAVQAGTLSAQAAFMAGRIRLGGDLGRLTGDARTLAALVGSFRGPGGARS